MATATRIPNVDYSQIPRSLRGMWVVVRVGERQEILASGESADEAMRVSGADVDDMTAVLTKVPIPTAVSFMGEAKD